MTGYAQSSSEHVFGALRGPADVVDREARRRRVETAVGAGVLIAILAWLPAGRGGGGRPPQLSGGHDHGALLPALDGGPARWPVAVADAQHHGLEVAVHSPDRAHVRELPGRPALRAAAARALGDRGDRGSARDHVPLAAAGAHRHLQLHQLRAHGGCPQPQPVHDDPGARAAQRPELCPEQLASAAEPVWTVVHADHLRGRPAGRGGVVLALEGPADAHEPGHSVSGVALRAPGRSRSGGGDRVRRPQPDRAHLGSRRRPQRLPDDVLCRARLLSAAARGLYAGGVGRGGAVRARAGSDGNRGRCRERGGRVWRRRCAEPGCHGRPSHRWLP